MPALMPYTRLNKIHKGFA